MLKIGVKYGHKRALFKYGEYLYKKGDKDKEEGKKLIIQSCNLGYKKARRFCNSHRIDYKSDDKKLDSNIQQEDKDYVIIKNKPNLNQRKTLFNFALITLDEDDKNDNIIDDQDELSIDELSSINENSSIINIEEDYYSSSEDKRSSNKEEVKEKKDAKSKSDKKDSKLYNIENDKKFRDLNKIKSDDDDFIDFDFWEK